MGKGTDAKERRGGRERGAKGRRLGEMHLGMYLFSEWCDTGVSKPWPSCLGPYLDCDLFLHNLKLRMVFIFLEGCKTCDKEYVTETIGIPKSKIFTMWPFTEKLADLWCKPYELRGILSNDLKRMCIFQRE